MPIPRTPSPRRLRELLPWVLGPAAMGLLGFTGLALQEQDPQASQDRTHPLTGFHRSEQERLEREVEGSWLLTSVETRDDPFDELDMSGFAQFHDGYLVMILNGYEEVAGFLTGVDTELVVQAHVFRYRMSVRGTLQAAGMMGFSNMNDGGELEFDGVTNVAEYDVLLDGDDLRLHHPDGRRFHFRRLARGELPEEALEVLRETRGGIPFDVDDDELGDG